MSVESYLMPAGTISAAAYYVLKNKESLVSDDFKDIKIIGFLDNVKGLTKGAEFCGLPVITLENAKKDIKVIIASYNYCKTFVRQAESLCFSEVILANEFLTPENTAVILDELSADNIEQKYKLLSVKESLNGFFIDHKKSGNPLIINKTEFVITQRCTLKCRDCSALIPFYEKPVNLCMDTAVKSVDRLFLYVDFIRTVNIIGGEPLFAKDISRLIHEFSDYRQKTSRLTIITNGTIVPDDEIIEAAKKNDFTFIISDYKYLSMKKIEIINKLNSTGVNYQILEHSHWNKMQTFSDTENLEIQQSFDCEAFCTQVMNGKLYYCNFLSHGDALRGYPYDENNFVDLFSANITKETIRDYIEREKALPGCNYCTGMKLGKNERIPVAVQVDAPLYYRKY